MGAENDYYSVFTEPLAHKEGEGHAIRLLREARIRAEAKAMKLLAARECPEDLKEWGRAHRIPEFAEFTWQAGFIAGMRAAEIKE